MPIKNHKKIYISLLISIVIITILLSAGLAYATYVQVTKPLPATVIVIPATSSGIIGDIDGNGVVNIMDLTIVAAYFNTSPPAYRLADINGDGVTDIIDLAQVAINFGKSKNP